MEIEVYEKKYTETVFPDGDKVAVMYGDSIMNTNSYGMKSQCLGYASRNIRFVFMGKAISKLLPEKRVEKEEALLRNEGFKLHKITPTLKIFAKKKYFIINNDEIDQLFSIDDDLNQTRALELEIIDLIRDINILKAERDEEKIMKIAYKNVLTGIESLSWFDRIFRFKDKIRMMREI